MKMTIIEADNYIRNIVGLHAPATIFNVDEQLKELFSHIHTWANGHEYELKLSGSMAKGTAISETTDIDIFISLHPTVKDYNTLENVYVTLSNKLKMASYTPREQNVSLGINHATYKIDLVPGVRQNLLSSDHSLWKRKQKTHTKTNIDKQIKHISNSGRAFDIKVIKIWRKLKNLDFPSVYLELSVLEALNGCAIDNPSGNFIRVMEYLRDYFINKRIIDPANTNNIISEDMTVSEKQKIKDSAIATLAGSWNQAIW